MYEAFYGLKAKAFSLVPDPHYLYLSRRHQAALNMLELAMRGQAGFSTITGEVGSGKTTIARRFLEMAEDNTTIGLITNTHEDLGELLEWILVAFNLDYKDKNKVELYETFVDFLFEQFAKGQNTVLLIDEAQNLTVSALEQLRVFSNIYDDQEHVLQIILIGQPELLDKLNRPELKQLAQRISVNFHLGPLNLSETAAYVRHRLAVAGAEHQVFDETACAAVYYFTGGIPRLINVLCDFALMYGFAEERPNIDHEIVWQVVRDKKETGLQVFTNTEQLGHREKVFGEILKFSMDINIAETSALVGNQNGGQQEQIPSSPGAPAPGREGAGREGADQEGPDQGTPVPASLVHESPTDEGMAGETPANVSQMSAARQTAGPAWQAAAKPEADLEPEQPIQWHKDSGFGPGRGFDEPAEEEDERSSVKIAVVITLVLFVLAGGAAAWITGTVPPALLSNEGTDQDVSREAQSRSRAAELKLPKLSVTEEPDITPAPAADSNKPSEPGATPAPAPKPAKVEQSAGVAKIRASVEKTPIPVSAVPEGVQDKSNLIPREAAVARVVTDTPRQQMSPPPSDEQVGLPPGPELLDFLESMDEPIALQGASEILLGLWGHSQTTAADKPPCQQATTAGLACFKESGSLARLIGYDRPAIINLRSESGKLMAMVLSAFNGESMTLQAAGITFVSKIGDIAPIVGGDQVVFWDPPGFYTGLLREGMSGPEVLWLRGRLAEVQAGSSGGPEKQDMESNVFDEKLTEQVTVFQNRHNLKPDGIVGPRTIMRLNLMAGEGDGPRLSVKGTKALQRAKSGS